MNAARFALTVNDGRLAKGVWVSARSCYWDWDWDRDRDKRNCSDPIEIHSLLRILTARPAVRIPTVVA